MPFRPRVPLSVLLSRLEITAGLRLCLDAGDSSSYSSGQTWLDTSGNGYDFWRGANNTATTDDPTFNGTPGRLSASEYWSFDGGDFFRYDSANETWMQNIHKAGAKGTFLAWYYPIAGVNNMACGTIGVVSGTPGAIGFWFGNGADNFPSLRVSNGSAQIGAYTSTSTIANAQWQFIAVSFDSSVGANGAFVQLDAGQQLLSGSFTGSPSASNASQTMEIGSRGAGAGQSPMPNGSRLAMLAIWEGVALTQAQVMAVYNATHSMPVFHKANRFFTRRF